jgi:hypothetical protein
MLFMIGTAVLLRFFFSFTFCNALWDTTVIAAMSLVQLLQTFSGVMGLLYSGVGTISRKEKGDFYTFYICGVVVSGLESCDGKDFWMDEWMCVWV